MALRIVEMMPCHSVLVAQLHAQSWRSTYRGMLRDAYLDGPIYGERLAVWTARLAKPQPNEIGLIAEVDATVVGFLFAMSGHHRIRGACLDSLHVSPQLLGQGIGSQLLLELSERLLRRKGNHGLYLWVTEGNYRACEYYRRLGAVAIERAEHEVPGGSIVAEWLYWWESVELLRAAIVA